jgi:hypothetical protein
MTDKTNPAATGIAGRANQALLFDKHTTAPAEPLILGVDIGASGAIAVLPLNGELLRERRR